jgi:hypothetical protein
LYSSLEFSKEHGVDRKLPPYFEISKDAPTGRASLESAYELWTVNIMYSKSCLIMAGDNV